MMIDAAPPPDDERIVDAASGALVDVTINGRPLKLRLDLEAADWIMLNAASAARAGLDGSMFKLDYKVGTVKVKINSSLTRVRVGPYNKKRRIFWADRPVVNAPADGTISPTHLAENRVTMRFHASLPGERIIELPVDHSMIRGLRHKVEVGGEDVWVAFAPLQARSVATAAAGAHLSTISDGHWAGPPEPVRIFLGVERPGRPMELRKTLQLDGVSSRGFLVRTSDYRGDYQLPQDEEEKADPDEVVITGKTKKGSAKLWLTLGKDSLGRCSSITHDKRRKMLILRCL
jgi:hypothetical protein